MPLVIDDVIAIGNLVKQPWGVNTIQISQLVLSYLDKGYVLESFVITGASPQTSFTFNFQNADVDKESDKWTLTTVDNFNNGRHEGGYSVTVHTQDYLVFVGWLKDIRGRSAEFPRNASLDYIYGQYYEKALPGGLKEQFAFSPEYTQPTTIGQPNTWKQHGYVMMYSWPGM